MTKKFSAMTAIALLALAACGEPRPASNNSAEDFAARINGVNSPAPAAQPPANADAPTVAAPVQQAAPGDFAPGTQTDPQSATCGANMMGAYMSRTATDAIRDEIQNKVYGVATEVRFLEPGTVTISPDPANPRLNLMLDERGIIRSAICG